MIRVTRRNGQQTDYNPKKIRDVIGFCSEGLEVNPLEIESHFTTKLRDGITTREIQDTLIGEALSLCSLNAPDWRYVAGRLNIWSLIEDTKVSRGYAYEKGHLWNAIQYQIREGRYARDITNFQRTPDRIYASYTKANIEEAESWIVPSRDFDYDYAGTVLLTKRYLVKDELPQEMYAILALLLADNEPKEIRLDIAKAIYDAISQRKISLATPILSNLRTYATSLSSCYILAVDDDLDSIFDALKSTARISKEGGGVGVNLSRIRATGSWVMGKPNASKGVLPWIKLFNDTAIAVDQGGKRAGAITVSLDCWHLDTIEFLECQTETGDPRRKAFDIFPQVVVTDEFMRRVRDDKPWYLVDPYEVKLKFDCELAPLWGENFEKVYQEIEENIEVLSLVQKVSARELFKEIMKVQLETGLPYITFKDTINRANPNKHIGVIPAANLCVESFSVVEPDRLSHVCNLVSLNLATIEDSEFPDICKLAVRVLDNAIDISRPPTIESSNHNYKFRTIGVGLMGLADWFAKKQLKYRACPELAELTEDFSYFCTAASVDLAKIRGCYPAFPESEWDRGLLINARPLEWFMENSKNFVRWINLANEIQVHGIRNSHIMAIAPNTSSGLLQGCTPSVLPPFSRQHWDKGRYTTPIMPPFIGSHFWFYEENKTLDQNVVVDLVSEIQKWVDTGISMELVFNLNDGVYGEDDSLTAKDIYDVMMKAWEQGCKAIYYVRSVQKDASKNQLECTACAN